MQSRLLKFNVNRKYKMNNKGIWLPIEVLRDTNLTWLERVILMEITQLSMLDKGCIAHNEHFAALFKIKKESASRTINSLVTKNYITVSISNRNHNRTITINKMLFSSKQNVIDSSTKCSETKENKTINKTYNSGFSNLWSFYNVGNKYKASQCYSKFLKEYKDDIDNSKKILIEILKKEKGKDNYHKHLTTILNNLIQDISGVYEEYKNIKEESTTKEWK